MGMKACYIQRDALFLLQVGCVEIQDAYPDSLGVFLVGSALEKIDYRDVDVRMVMRDEDFDKAFGTGDTKLIGLTCRSISAWLKHLTGLPVDFQVQKMSIANERHKGKPRNSMMYVPWIGDGID